MLKIVCGTSNYRPWIGRQFVLNPISWLHMDCRGYMDYKGFWPRKGCRGYTGCKGWPFSRHKGYRGCMDCLRRRGCKRMISGPPRYNSKVLPVHVIAIRVALKLMVRPDKIAPCLLHRSLEVLLAA